MYNNGFVLHKKVSVHDLHEKTPETNAHNIGATKHIARVQACLMNNIVSYEAEANGSLFQDIVPSRDMVSSQSSMGSCVELEIHTEQAFSNLRPDVISLACLRGDPEAYTHLLPVDRVIENVTPEEIETLQQPLWKIGVDLSFRSSIDDTVRGPIPILYKEERGGWRFVFDQDLMIGTTPEATELIRKIVDIYYKHRTSICLEPGDILMVDNNRVVHGRSAFKARFDGYDRFLVRCFGMHDLSRIEHARSGHMILAKYS
jgi:L-asparagine oxygenase